MAPRLLIVGVGLLSLSRSARRAIATRKAHKAIVCDNMSRPATHERTTPGLIARAVYHGTTASRFNDPRGNLAKGGTIRH